MKSENIFLSLSKNMPKENYFTNCFAFLLSDNKRLLLFLLKKILGKKGEHLVDFTGLKKSNHTVEPQELSSKGVVDIKITFPNLLEVSVENKLTAPVTHRQLRKYLASRALVFLITEKEMAEGIPRDIVDHERFFHTTWAIVKDLLEFYSCHLERDRIKKLFLVRFLNFMEGIGVKSFSGFAKEEYGPYWQKFAEFRESAEYILDKLWETMDKHGFRPIIREGYGTFGYLFLPKKFRWRFPYGVQFDVEGGTANITVFIQFQKMFREFVRDEFFEETERVSEKLGNNFDIVWDRNRIYRTVRLIDLVKEAKSKNLQKEKILGFMTETFKQFERSGLTSLLEKAARQYK